MLDGLNKSMGKNNKLAAIKEKARQAKLKRRAIQAAEPHPSESAFPSLDNKDKTAMQFKEEII